ncbi:hypothetical protein [Variovorax sp. SRS16]|nr:hypothetical protein [Variovorax sp. SRS16]
MIDSFDRTGTQIDLGRLAKKPPEGGWSTFQDISQNDLGIESPLWKKSTA